MPRPSQRLWRRAVVTLALIFVTGGAIGAGCADRLVLAPSTDHRDAGEAAELRVPFDGGLLQIWTARSPGVGVGVGVGVGEPRAFLLEFCGNGTRAEDIAAYLAKRWGDRPIEVWAVNYPGYGGSTGPPRLRTIGPAALVAYDALARRADGRPIITGGHSLGTAAALDVAAHRAVAGVFLHNPPVLRRLILGEYGWWNLWLIATPVSMQIPSALDSVANAKASHAPAVIVTALGDTFVPPKYHKMVIDAYAGPKHVIALPNANHNTPLETAEGQLQQELSWLWAEAVRSSSDARDVQLQRTNAPAVLSHQACAADKPPRVRCPAAAIGIELVTAPAPPGSRAASTLDVCRRCR